MENYKKLENHFSEIAALRQIDGLLDWDRSVTMPEKGASQRGRQLEVLNVKIHGLQTDPLVGEWISKVNRGNLNEWQAANLRLIERNYMQATAVPAELIGKKIRQATKTESIWRGAKADNDFKRVADDLQQLVDITREIAEVKAHKLKTTPYGALMEPYAPGMTVEEVDAVFDDLAAFLPPFIREVTERQKSNPPKMLQGKFPQAKQVELCNRIAGMLGFDPGWSRLDASSHPMSSGVGDDVRITTRYDENDFMSAIQGVTHEVGHGLFDHHVPEEWVSHPVGQTGNMGMAIHESQSLSFDMQLSRSRAFWQAVAPVVREFFPDTDDSLAADNLYRLATKVRRGFIRVDADEVTYPAHIIFRYQLERAMIEGKLQVKDLPHAWAAEMEDLLDITPPDDRRGCLQDIHWHIGYFGYFPAYALGAIIAAQFAATMAGDVPGVWDRAAEGNFAPFAGWLRDNVQSKACLYEPQELITRVTGSRMSADAFKKHLAARYLEGRGR